MSPEGKFLASVPNASLYVDAYLDPDQDISHFIVYEPALKDPGSRMDYLNYMFYMDGHHKFMFDEENLLNILKMKGFQQVQLRNFDPAIDHKARDYESIYVEALAPSE